MFHKARLWERFRTKFNNARLADMLRAVVGEATFFGSEKLKTLLMMVLRSATTDSPWPLSNNPAAKYNDKKRPDCNLTVPLWQLVRASTAAPTYFPPEVIEHGGREFIFRRRWGHNVQQPGIPGFPDGHDGPVQPSLAYRGEENVSGSNWDRHEHGCERKPQSGGYESPLQRELEPAAPFFSREAIHSSEGIPAIVRRAFPLDSGKNELIVRASFAASSRSLAVSPFHPRASIFSAKSLALLGMAPGLVLQLIM